MAGSAATGRGMKNIGNSCFMNAALQALTSIRPLHTFLNRNAIFHGPFSKFTVPTVKRPASPLLMALIYTLRELTLTGQSNFDPKKLASVPLLRDNLMKDKEQQDAEELFQVLLAAVDDESDLLLRSLRANPPPAAILLRHAEGPKPKLHSSLWGPEHHVGVLTRGKKAKPKELRTLLGLPVQLRFEKNPFSGELASTLQCTKCKSYSTLRMTKFNDLSLSLPRGNCSLEECLEFFTAIENVQDVECETCTAQRAATENLLSSHQQTEPLGINGSASRLLSATNGVHLSNGNGYHSATDGLANGNGTYSSSSSKKGAKSSSNGSNGKTTPPPVIRVKSVAQKREQIARAPAALCLHLRRLIANSSGMPVKLETHVSFPVRLNLSPFCLFNKGLGGKVSSSPTPHDVLYSLVAVIVHHGTAYAGHYTVFRRVPTRSIPTHKEYEGWVKDEAPGGSKWVHFSDENLTPASEETVLNAQAYMLFYERIGGSGASAARANGIAEKLNGTAKKAPNGNGAVKKP